MRKPTTNPKINGLPMSFVRLSSEVAGTTMFGKYTRLAGGQIVGHPRLMREVKGEARQSRLVRRDDFRYEKRGKK
jgi:hypothetical protein